MVQALCEWLRCPDDRSHLHLDTSPGHENLVCACGHRFPVIRDIPRFVPKENYAASFGLQWNRHRLTQLDSYSGVPISRDRLTRMAGGSLDIFSGKTVLEAGCGAGRFTEILLQAGARVFAVDLSTAVDAALQNVGGHPNFFVCQADILKLPFEPDQFDMVVCIGVVQHTPSPEETMTTLCSYVKPGGSLILDHYTYGYPATTSRRLLRALLLRMPAAFSLRFCQLLHAILWPVHRALWKYRKQPGLRRLIGWLRPRFIRVSPLVDYQEAYPQLGPRLWKEWAMLDTHDTLTDVYKHMRSPEEIASHLQKCNMIDVEAVYGGNGVEVRARKPALSQS